MNFNFKSFCKKYKFAQETIDVLTAQKLDDEFTLSLLTLDTILSLKLATGEVYRLDAALNEVFHPETLIKQEPGATASPEVNTTDPVASGEERQPVQKETVQTLARDTKLAALLAEFLGSSENSGVKSLLDLGEIKRDSNSRAELERPQPTPSRSDAIIQFRGVPKSGILTKQGEKPLLISDFLSSNLNVSYGTDANEEVLLSSTTKLVFDKKTKKPEVWEYTPDIWSAASFRILVYLVQIGSASRTILEYADYSAMICDYLSMYVNQGVFKLDETHRYRVAYEGRVWNDICDHDQRKFLKFVESDHASTQPKNQPKRSKNQRRKVTDTEGRTVCWNYNSKRGCELTQCRYSHVCADCFSKHPQYECPKQKTK